MIIRLQKFLADAGIASRRKAEALITAGAITVNGEVVKKLGTKINPATDAVTYRGLPVQPAAEKIYLALHKPSGYVSSTSSTEGKSIIQLVKSKARLYPVGRLDRDSSGLILLTNDGEFANKISHARYGGEKEYFVTLDQDLRDEDIKKLQRGMTIGGKKLQPVTVVAAKNKSARLILKEGINRQIRRQLGRLGYTVVKLKRIRIGKLELGNLAPGQSKAIDPDEVM